MKSDGHKILQYYHNISSTQMENYLIKILCMKLELFGSVLGDILLISCCWFVASVKHVVTSSELLIANTCKVMLIKDLKYII